MYICIHVPTPTLKLGHLNSSHNHTITQSAHRNHVFVPTASLSLSINLSIGCIRAGSSPVCAYPPHCVIVEVVEVVEAVELVEVETVELVGDVVGRRRSDALPRHDRLEPRNEGQGDSHSQNHSTIHDALHKLTYSKGYKHPYRLVLQHVCTVLIHDSPATLLRASQVPRCHRLSHRIT